MGSSHYCLFLIMASFVLMIPFYAQHIRRTVYPLSCAMRGAAVRCSERLRVRVKAAHGKKKAFNGLFSKRYDFIVLIEFKRLFA